MDDVRAHPIPRPGEGTLAALGYLQIGTGVLTLTMSLFAFSQAMFGYAEVLNPATIFASSSGLIDRAIATYVALQLTLGWLAGGLQLAAGLCCLRSSHPRLVWLASLVSLGNFPHGTLAAILVLLSLRRAEIVEAFAAREGA